MLLVAGDIKSSTAAASWKILLLPVDAVVPANWPS